MQKDSGIPREVADELEGLIKSVVVPAALSSKDRESLVAIIVGLKQAEKAVYDASDELRSVEKEIFGQLKRQQDDIEKSLDQRIRQLQDKIRIETKLLSDHLTNLSGLVEDISKKFPTFVRKESTDTAKQLREHISSSDMSLLNSMKIYIDNKYDALNKKNNIIFAFIIAISFLSLVGTAFLLLRLLRG